MSSEHVATPTLGIVRIHRAWAVAGVTFLVLLASAAFRSSYGLMLVPIESDLGWTRAATSLAVSVNLVFYGLTAPFAAALMERIGVRRVAVAALLLIAAGTGLTVFMTQPWQLVLLWGVVAGLGVGATALVFGALITNRWFVQRRGLVMGLLGAAFSTGQLIFLPTLAHLVDDHGWRSASVLISAMALALVPLVIMVVRDRPSDIGELPYGATEAVPEDPPTQGAARRAVTVLAEAGRAPVFWVLAGTFFVCGWTTNGIVSTHFVPTGHDHGMAATTAASMLAVVGVFDIIGTIGSGWLTDRYDPRILLGVYYLLRGVALAAVPIILGPAVEPSLLVVMMFMGLDWVATVPPTATLCRTFFGPERGAIVFGWVFAAHMIGAAVAATLSGILRDTTGSYSSSWWLAAVLAIGASAACLAIPATRGRHLVSAS